MGDSVNILHELNELNSAILINTERKSLYTYPDGYFEDLSENILREVWIQSLPKINPYSVSAGYFENLPEIIIDKLAVKSALISDITSKDLFNVPNGYFNDLSHNILQKINNNNNNVRQELEELSPLLSSIPKTNVYTVPENYFETLAVKHKLNKQPAKVISIGSKTRQWFTYAVAACIAAVMFGGGYYYMQTKSDANNTSTASTKIAAVNVEQAVLQLSDFEIDSYLKDDNSDIYTNQNSDNQDINIKTLLENMSDNEIDNYLLKNAEPGEKTKRI